MSRTLRWANHRSHRVSAKYRWCSRVLCAFCALTPALSGGPVEGTGPVPARHVLVISSYHEGNPWNDAVVHGIGAVFKDAGVGIDPDFEYLDFRRHPEPSHVAAFVHLLREKLAQSPPDVIVATDDPAVKLVMKYRGTELPATPVVFCGVNEFQGSSAYVSDHPEQRPWMAGVLELFDLDATVDLALELHPNTREFVIVGEAEGLNFVGEIASRHPGLRVREIPALHLPFQEVAKQVDQLKSGSVVLFTPFLHDGTGHFLRLAQSTMLIADHCKVPMYTLNRATLGYGPIGGKMSDPYLQGQSAASMALSVLSGVPPSALGVQRSLGNLFEFDYKQLQRWKIRQSRLPKGSLTINRPRTLRENHPLLTIAAVVFVAVQMLVITILLVQRRRRQIAEAALRRHSQQLANSNYMLEQFAYITAHDFQEPIRSVAVFSELLYRSHMDGLNSEGRQAVQFINDNSRRLHSMVRGLRAWVRSVEAPPDSVLWCDVNQIWLNILDKYRSAIERNDVSVTSSHLPQIAVHPNHMLELLDHLLENALQHSNTPRLCVALQSVRADNGWKFSLYNSGQPIPEAFQSRIFGVFRRLQLARNGASSEERVGMGLAICRRIVDFYGGRIWVEPGSSEGCVFCFTIPDKPRPRARRPHLGIWQTISLSSPTHSSSTHAHSGHRG